MHLLTEAGMHPSCAVDKPFLLPLPHWTKAAASVPPTTILMIARILSLDWSAIKPDSASARKPSEIPEGKYEVTRLSPFDDCDNRTPQMRYPSHFVASCPMVFGHRALLPM